ncbi:MAG: hypothetical protein JXA54_10740 [Candidatus Heimdallarchaeota archaeon]|nr:hypothetical protein [Candidatus Heimdallarchaeota archaeon]
MKLDKKTVSIILVILFTFLPTSLTNTQGLQTRDYTVYEMSFIHAEYLDADLDGYEDDTRFLVDIYLNPDIFDGSEIRLDCLFEIILPSNTTYTFKGYIRFNSVSCIIQFDVYNTVTEPGWYTINFYSYVKVQMTKYTSFCTTIFDPPTGIGGGGAPTVGL